MTGFGRTGKLFASEFMNEKPDIICLSKGLTGGTMALGVTACNKKIYNAYVDDDSLKTFFHGHSFTANPLACTVANASLDLLLQENCFESIKNIGIKHAHFAEKLLTETHQKPIKNVRTLGTILAFEIDEGEDEYLNNISKQITLECLKRGVYLRPLGNTLYIMPPYCITEAELEKIYETIIEILN